MSTTRTPRAARKRAWETESIVVRKRLARAAHMARWVAAPLLFLQFLAMLAFVFNPVATIMADLDVLTPVVAGMLVVVIIGDYGWVGARVWRDAKGRNDKKTRLHLAVTPVVALVLAFFVRSYATEVLDVVYDGFYGSTLKNASTAFPVLVGILILGLALQMFILWLLIQLPLGVIRRLSMAIRTAGTQPFDEDTDTRSERRKRAKTPGSARFVPAFVLAFLAWSLWLAFFDAGLIGI